MNVPIDIAAKTAAELVEVYRERNEQLEQYAQWYEQEYEPQAREHIEQLEDLCRDMLEAWNNEQELSAARPLLVIRMDALGLLEVSSNA